MFQKTMDSSNLSIILVLSFIHTLVGSVEVQPVMTTSGSVRIVCLLDLHTSVSNNNTCSNPRTSALQVAFVSLWKLDTLLKEKGFNDIGISVYDVCGSQTRAIRILSGHIGNTNQKLGGVISYTSPDVTSAISDVLRYLHVLHIDITDDVTSCQDEVSCISISVASRAKAEAVFELSRSLNWTYLTTLALPNIRATTEEKLFKDLASTGNICLSDRRVLRDIRGLNAAAAKSESSGIVVFVGDAQLDRATTLSLPVQKSAIIVSKDLTSYQDQDNYIKVASVPVPFDGLKKYLTSFNAPETLQWIRNTAFFQGTCMVAGSDVMFMIVSCIKTVSSPESLAISDAVSVLTEALVKGVNSSCSEFDVTSCPAVSLASTSASVSALVRHYQWSMEHRRLLVESGSDVTMMVSAAAPVNTTEIQTKHGRLHLPTSFPSQFYLSRCEGACFECSTCTPHVTSDEKVLVHEGTVYIVGVFPLQSSVSGHACAGPDVPGFQAAKAFTAAVDRINSTGLIADLPDDVSIGWVVFDSCGDAKWFQRKHHEIETCLYSYKDADGKNITIQPSRTIAYLNFERNGSPPSISKPSASVSRLGVGLNADASDLYAKAVVSSLVQSKWTYLSLIHSDDALSRTFLKHAQSHMENTPLCFDGVYTISDRLTAAGAMQKVRIETKTVVLLTNITDTTMILANLPSGNRKLRLLMFPWNVGALEGTTLALSVEEILVIWPRPLNNQKTGTDLDMSGDPWFEGFQESGNRSDISRARAQYESNMIVAAVNTLASQINSAYSALCPEKKILCERFADFKNIKAHMANQSSVLTKHDIVILRFDDKGRILSKKVGKVEPGGKTNMILDGTVMLPSVSSCSGWCPRCQKCDGFPSPKNRNLYLPGDVIVAGVLPLRESGQSGGLRCGPISNSLDSEQLAEAFMFAVETYPTRYPHLLPSVRVGGLLIDSCSDVNTAMQAVTNFETCTTKMADADDPPHPAQTLGYVVHGSHDDVRQLRKCVSAVNKLTIATVPEERNSTPGTGLTTEYESRGEATAIVQILTQLNWTQIVLVISDIDTYRMKSDLLLTEASSRSVCVSQILRFDSTKLHSLQYVASQIAVSGFLPVVVMASKEDTVKIFEQDIVTRARRPWLVSTSGPDWTSTSNLVVPVGTLLLDRRGKASSQFADVYSNVYVGKNASSWWKEYWQEKVKCTLTEDTSVHPQPCHVGIVRRPRIASQLATRVILAVDVILHAVHNEYVNSCEGKAGFCRRFADEGIRRIPATARTVAFEFEDEVVKFTESGMLVSSFVIYSSHPQGRMAAGEWRNGRLHLDMEKLYSGEGQLDSVGQCSQRDCRCINNVTTTRTPTAPEAVYWVTSGKFNGELWATIIVAISAAGAFVTVILMVYVLYKVFAGALAKRYVGLGLLLLIGVFLLYLAVLPFVFTPSHSVCALRFFAPGVTYCLCFAAILVKMTSIQDYKLIGLGGEVSNLNQFLSVFFITAVQLAVGIQHWILKGSFLEERTSNGVLQYACSFQRSEFLVYLVYVMFVLVMCSIYGIGVRKEQKNMGEARLLLISSWLCVVVWLAWTVVMAALDIRLSDPVISSGIISCATLMLTVIFIPKIHMVARLRYDVSKQSTTLQNGYKIDPDFMFERPYSLPGTLTSTYSSVKTYPKSIEHFDSSLSY